MDHLMNVQVTYYLDVISSWCYWAEPAWLELKERYARKPVQFDWKIALLDQSGMPATAEQEDWFYRRSGTIVRSPFMLNSGWFDSRLTEYLAPNCVAEAVRDLGVTDDRVRLAMAEATMRKGQKVGKWEISVGAAVKVAPLNSKKLLAHAQSSMIEKRVRSSTAEFHSLKVTQRPTFVLADDIGDRAVLSGLVKPGPIASVIDAMLEDSAAYASYAAHYGSPP